MSFAQPHPSGPAGSRPGKAKRPTWHWVVLGGCSLLALLIALGVAGLVGYQILNRGNPQDTLENFYTSMENGDCQLFEESTTEEYRQTTQLEDCATFETMTSQMGALDYTVDERVNRQGYAIFEVTETYQRDGQDVEAQLRFYVRRFEGGWFVDGVEVVDAPTTG